MKNSQILARLDIGKSVAENDQNLGSYFVPTVALEDFLMDRYDLIRGVKGSGKSALLKVVVSRQAEHPELENVLLYTATEHAGEPSFKRAFDRINRDAFTEKELVSAWKTYLINLVLDVIEDIKTPEALAAVEYAQKVGIRFKTVSNYKKIMWSLLRALHIRSFSISADGLQAEFPDAPPDIWLEKQAVVDFPEALNLCVQALAIEGKRCWVLVDRLDAAFQEDPQLERAALKTLLMAYKDFMGFEQIRLKLFLRTDLFDQVTTDGGFRELTHVQDRTSPPMSWDSDQLQTMIMERFLFNEPIREKYGVSQADMRSSDLRVATFFSIFPKQIEVGSRQTDSWTWMLNRITDANGVRTPRDLHSLVTNATRAEARFLSVGGNDVADVLITSAAVKTGLDQLSADKIKTTLFAENPALEHLIRAFKGGKAEHNAETLEKLLGAEWANSIEDLQRIGFIEKIRGSDSWKIPQIYRPGLEITQGAAFAK